MIYAPTPGEYEPDAVQQNLNRTSTHLNSNLDRSVALAPLCANANIYNALRATAHVVLSKAIFHAFTFASDFHVGGSLSEPSAQLAFNTCFISFSCF